ncbi:MAG: hypothetical protein P8Y45_17860 [Exilibacterium sp.]
MSPLHAVHFVIAGRQVAVIALNNLGGDGNGDFHRLFARHRGRPHRAVNPLYLAAGVTPVFETLFEAPPLGFGADQAQVFEMAAL